MDLSSLLGDFLLLFERSGYGMVAQSKDKRGSFADK